MAYESRVSEFEEFETEGLLAGGKQRSWFWFGLIVSLALHIALCTYFYRTHFISIDPRLTQTDQTPMFKVRNVDLNSQLDKNSIDQTNPAAKPEADKSQDQQPDQKKSFDQLLQDIQASTAMPDDLKDVLPDTPQAPDATAMMTEIERTTAQTLSNSPNATREQTMLNDSAVSGRPLPALTGNELATSTSIKRPNTFASKMPADSAGPNKGRSPGYADLDQLLAQKGDQSVTKVGYADQTQPEGDVHRGRLYRFLRIAGIQSGLKPAASGQRETIPGAGHADQPGTGSDPWLRPNQIPGAAQCECRPGPAGHRRRDPAPAA
jgi:hypothetical protein